MWGRMGAHAQHARHDPRSTTSAARQALVTKWEREVDPNGTLSSDELAKRVAHKRAEHMARMTKAAADARRARA